MNTAMKGQSSGRFLGVNLRRDRVSLADDEVAKAINADLHSQPGTIILRLGRTAQNMSALTDLVIRRIAKINGHRYRVAGQSVYCDETRIMNGLLSANLITTMLPFRPFADTTIWNFIADDAVMRKANCATIGTWGIPQPDRFSQAAVPTTVEGIPGNLTGTYVAQYTFCRLVNGAVAAEGNPSGMSLLVNPLMSLGTLGIGDISHPDDPTTNGLGIYRSTGFADISNLDANICLLDARVQIPTDNSAYTVTYVFEVTLFGTANLYLHWSVDLILTSVGGAAATAAIGRGTQTWERTTNYLSGTADGEDINGRHGTHRWEVTLGYIATQTINWAYGSTKADIALSVLVEVDNGMPPTASWVVPFQEHAFLCRDATNPHYLWFSKRFKPEAFPAENFLELGNADDPLQCAGVVAGQLGVFSRKTKYRVFGNDTSGFASLEAMSPRGTPCPMAMISTELGLVFVARDGIFSTVLSSPDTNFASDILPLFFGETVNDMLPINWDQANTFSAATYKGRYYLSYTETGFSTPNRLAVYSRDTEHWYHYDHPLRSLYVEEDTDLCLGGGLDGFVYVLENGTTDNGASIALDVDTKDFQGESKDARKLFLYLKVDANTLGESVTVKFYVDDVLKRTATMSTSTRTERLLPLPQGTLGHHWRANFTYTGSARILIYPCAALYLPLGAA